MDPEDVSRLVKELELSADAGEAVVTLNEEDINMGAEGRGTRFHRFVVGKIFAARVVNRETLRSQLPRILQIRGDPDIEIVGDNLFVVVFANNRDRQHAIVDGPWHFFDNLMMFQEPKGMEKPSDVVFATFTTWIQCHNLPIVCMNPVMVRRIAEHVERVEEIDVGDGGNCLGQYARARVSRELNKPLQRCVSIMTGDNLEKHIILIRYERLPEFCNACGRVGHDSRHCDDPTADKNKMPFGVWLKATRTVDSRRWRGEIQRMGSTHETEMTLARNYDLGKEIMLAGRVQSEPGHGREVESEKKDQGVEYDVDMEAVQGSESGEGGVKESNQEPDGSRVEIGAGTSRKGGGNERGVSNKGKSQAALTTFRAKNILLPASPTKKVKTGWKKRARLTGKHQEELRSPVPLSGQKRKGEDGMEREEQNSPKRLLTLSSIQTDIAQQETMDNTLVAAAEQPR